MNKRCIALVLCILVIPYMYGQQKKAPTYHTVSGVVVDSATGEKLQGVTVRVISEDPKNHLGAITGPKGEFKIERISAADARLQLSQVGYQVKVMPLFEAGSFIKANMGNIKLQAATVQMGGVEIKATRPMIEYQADKQIINMEKVPGANGSVTDALRNSGAVDVDPQSNKISIRGRSSVNILIDGKPQPMAEDMLTQMPATMIDQVEIVANPSAKDDPEGDAGIINFITKKGTSNNYSGSVTAYKSSKNMQFGSTFINYKHNDLTAYASVNGGGGEFDGDIDGYQISNSSVNNYKTISEGENSRKGFMMNAKTGFDYDFDTANSLSFSGSLYKMKGDGYEHSLFSIYKITDALNYNYNSNNDGNLDYNVYSLTSNYKKKFDKKGHEITGDVFFSYTDNENPTTLTTTYSYSPSDPTRKHIENNTGNKTLIAKLDYVNPTFASIGKIETGYNFTFRDRTTDYNVFNMQNDAMLKDLSQSNNFTYKESIHALYATLSSKLFFLDYKLGARLEHIFSHGIVELTNEKFDLDYSSFFPSLMLSYPLNDRFQITLNVSRRIRRPQMEYINPFKRENSHNNYFQGNPDLQPTYTNQYELAFSPILKLYTSYSTGRPVQITTVQDSITTSYMVNNASTKTYGAEITIPLINDPRMPVKLPDWIVMITLQGSYLHYEESNDFLTENYSIKRNTWNMGGNMSFKLPLELNLSVYGRFTPEVKDDRTITNPRSFVGLNISREFMEKKLKISVMANDIFNNSTYRTQTFGSNYYNDSKYHNLMSSSFGISITYLFNDFKQRQERNIDDGRDKSDNGMF
ncbi:MAG: TonB-dependent receptor family protein [Ignavibacteria bacterium]|nr:TonB-dependent receptor family protein [Ignavibacteria bacterium]